MANPALAIVGGGASSIILLAQIAKIPEAAGMQIDVYERTGAYGRGLAYSTSHKVHLLNVRAAMMSAYADDKDHFARWAVERGYNPLSFVPRMEYGDYLCEQLEVAKSVLKLNFLSDDILSIRKIGKEGFELDAGKRKTQYPEVVLATGNVRPMGPRVEGDVVTYYDAPWKIDYSTLKQMQSIGLIGSGLSAIDTVLALYSKEYRGKILIFSRHSLLPASHVEPVSYTGLPVEGIESLSPYGILRLLRIHAREARKKDIPWQGVIDALRPHINTIWEKWTKRQREKFMKRLFTIWNVHRHRMAPQIADVVHGLIKAGRIELVQVNVEAIGAGPVIVTNKDRYNVDAVINCMGYRYREEGRNFDVTHKIGPARFGDVFETTAVPEIRAQAAEIITKILKSYSD